MKKNDYETSRPANKERPFLRFMRYAGVAIVTLCLLALLIVCEDTKNDGLVYLFVYLFLFAAFALFCITIPIIGLWIYSFAKAITRRTKTDKILLWLVSCSRLAPVGNDCLCVQPALSGLRCLHHGRIL